MYFGTIVKRLSHNFFFSSREAHSLGGKENTKNVNYKCLKKIRFQVQWDLKGRIINFVLEAARHQGGYDVWETF